MELRAGAVVFVLVCLSCGLSQGGEHFFDSDDVKLRYTDDGDGEPVVLIHGFMANGHLNWGLPGIVDLLADEYRVITLDQRGHGMSDKPVEVAAYGQAMVDDVVRLLNHLNIDQAHLVGYSMGGMVAMKCAATYPDRVKSAVIGGMGWIDGARRPRAGGGSHNGGAELKPLAACRLGFGALGITKGELKGIETPLTIVIGANDGLLARVRPLEEARPDIPVVLIAEANHVNCFFKSEFKQALKAFLDAHRGDGGP